MVNSALQLTGYISGLIGSALSLVVCVMPEWRRQDMVGEVIEMQVKKQGIWWNCQYFSTGQWHCDDFDRMLLGLPPELQAARALMVIGCMFGFLGYLLSNVGLACTSMMADSPESKRKVAITGGTFWLLNGLCTGVAVSFYAALVVQDFYQSGGMSGQGLGSSGGVNTMGASGTRFVYGTALFLGWASMVLGLIGGACQISATCSDNDDDDDDFGAPLPNTNRYNPPPRSEFI